MSQAASQASSQSLPVDSREISSKSHVILRLDQIQRSLIEDPHRFELLEDDRSLNHVRQEVKQLQAALMQAAKEQVEQEKQALLRANELLMTWQSESELKDILVLDGHRRANLFEQAARCEKYYQWVTLIEQFQEERSRLFNKYRGYFQGQQQDIELKKSETQKKLKPLQPKMDEWRLKREMLQQQQMTVNYYYQQSTHYLVVGIASLGGLILAGHYLGPRIGLWPGWFWGLIAGYSVFTFLASRFAYVTDKPMQDLYDFLMERYQPKNVRPFFRFEDKEKPQQPTRFDATRGDVLSQILQKDILAAGSEFGLLERQRQEHHGYLQYLEGRRQWAQAQIERMDTLEPLPEEPKEPEIKITIIEGKTGELSKIPPLEELPEPEKPVPLALPVEIPHIEPKGIAGRKVRPAKIKDGAMPERAS